MPQHNMLCIRHVTRQSCCNVIFTFIHGYLQRVEIRNLLKCCICFLLTDNTFVEISSFYISLRLPETKRFFHACCCLCRGWLIPEKIHKCVFYNWRMNMLYMYSFIFIALYIFKAIQIVYDVTVHIYSIRRTIYLNC